MGSVKSLFQAQWMTNHSIKAIKDQLDLASKLIFQTADSNFVGQNALSAIESGDIMVTKENMPLTQLQNNSHDITSLQSFGQQWQVLAQELVSTPDIMSGQNMPSGTAFRQAAIIQQEAHSNFEVMTENKGLHLEQMFRRFITPHILKKMDNTDEVSATLDAYGIDKIDVRYISNKATKAFNDKMIEAVLNDQELPNMQEEMQSVKGELDQMGGQRFIKPSDIDSVTWKDVIGEFEGSVVYEITGENKDKQAVMATLSTVFQTIATNPMILQDPNARLVFDSILSETNAVSPLQLAEVKSQPVMQQPVPSGGMVGQGINNNQMTQ
jgi:hypothetical protein